MLLYYIGKDKIKENELLLKKLGKYNLRTGGKGVGLKEIKE